VELEAVPWDGWGSGRAGKGAGFGSELGWSMSSQGGVETPRIAVCMCGTGWYSGRH